MPKNLLKDRRAASNPAQKVTNKFKKIPKRLKKSKNIKKKFRKIKKYKKKDKREKINWTIKNFLIKIFSAGKT